MEQGESPKQPSKLRKKIIAAGIVGAGVAAAVTGLNQSSEKTNEPAPSPTKVESTQVSTNEDLGYQRVEPTTKPTEVNTDTEPGYQRVTPPPKK